MNGSRERAERSDRRIRIAAILLGLLLVTGFIAKLIMEAEKMESISVLQESKLAAERLLGDKLQLEETVHELGARIEECAAALVEAEARTVELQRKLDARGKRGLDPQAWIPTVDAITRSKEVRAGYQPGRDEVSWDVPELDRTQHDVR